MSSFKKHRGPVLIGFIIALILSPIPAKGMEKTPFTIQDSLRLRSLSPQSITDDGRYIAATISTRGARLGTDHRRYRDPTYISPRPVEVVILDTDSGKMTPVFRNPVEVRGLTWSPDGKTLAFLLRRGEDFVPHAYDRTGGKTREIKLRTNKRVSTNSPLIWKNDGTGLLMTFRGESWAEQSLELFREATVGPVVVYDSREPFLKWDMIRDQALLQIPALVEVKTGTVRELLPEERYSAIRVSGDDAFVTYVVTYPIKTEYGQNYYRQGGREYSLYRLGLEEGADPMTLIARREQRINLRWNEENTLFAWAEKGDIFIQGVGEPEPRNLTGGKAEEEGADPEAEPGKSDRPERTEEEEKEKKTRFSLMRFSPDGSKLLASTKQGYWLIDHRSGDVEMIFEFPEEEGEEPVRGDPSRRSLAAWSPEGNTLYFSTSATDKWERGFSRFDLTTRRMEELVKDANLYRGVRMAKNGEKFFFGFSDGDHPEDLYVAKSDFQAPRRLTDLNPWIEERKLTRSELIKYRDVDGNELHGILYYPVDYQPGRRYPLVCEIYERFFHNSFNTSMNIIANQGWFGLRPSVELEIGYPGEAWVKGVTCAINTLIDRGLVDPDRLGVHGTSYGGYAASLLITQTDRFAAAVNISGKVNIISFLGDSPRIGHRNYGAAETGQDRLGQTLWEAPLKYINHSAVMFADRIQTPHLLITGEGDWNVPGGNTRELYYALRRLGKECVWVNYWNDGHGMGSAADEATYLDKWNRVLDWYREYFAKAEEDSGKKK